MTRQDLLEQREQIQENLICILDGVDGVPDAVVTLVCQAVVDGFAMLLEKQGKGF